MTTFQKAVTLVASTGPVGGASGTDANGVVYNYTTPVFNADFLSPSEVVSGAGTVANFYNTAGATYSIANSLCTMSSSPSPNNNGFDSSTGASGNLSTPSAHGVANTNGLNFRYGYFEARIKFDFTNTGGTYPSFFLWGGYYGDSTSEYLEIDFMESNAPSGGSNQRATYTAIHEWSKAAGGGANAHFSPVNAMTPDTSLLTNTDFNVYACLWTNNTVTFYYNGTAGPLSNLATSQTVNYAGNWGSIATPNPRTVPAGTTTTGPVTIGTGANFPSIIDWVRVWQ